MCSVRAWLETLLLRRSAVILTQLPSLSALGRQLSVLLGLARVLVPCLARLLLAMPETLLSNSSCFRMPFLDLLFPRLWVFSVLWLHSLFCSLFRKVRTKIGMWKFYFIHDF